MKQITDKFPKILIVLIFISFLVVVSFKKPTPNNVANTYFDYSQSEKDDLKNLETNNLKGDFYFWENEAHRLSQKLNSPPATTAKIYAYLATAFRDAALLSREINGSQNVNFDSLGALILCEFYKKECTNFQKTSKDIYSQKLANLIFEKLIYRMKNENDLAIEGMRAELPLTGPAIWSGQNPTTPDAKYWTPWHMESPSQFRAEPPPEFGSEEDALEVEKVRNALANATQSQKEAARYWASDSPASLWKEISNEYIADKNLSFEELLDFKFIFYTTIADAFISCWDTKLTYWTKRPIERGLPSLPLVVTPNFPSYTSGHSTISAAAATILSKYFPENENEWRRLSEEARDSRLWAGIHFDIDNQKGYEIGEDIANFILQKAAKNY